MSDRPRYEVRIDVSIRDNQGGGGLSISEQGSLEAGSFMELAGILGQFHEVFEKLKKASS